MSHPFLVVVVALKAANSKIPPVCNFLETQLCVGPIWSQLSWRHNFVLLSCGLPKVNWGAGHILIHRQGSPMCKDTIIGETCGIVIEKSNSVIFDADEEDEDSDLEHNKVL